MNNRGIGFFIIVLACIVSLGLGFMCGGCTQAEPAIPPKQPEPSRVIATFKVGSVWGGTVDVTEFRDSSGRVCVLAYQDKSVALSCGRPLPPMDYEDLPPVEGEQQ